MKRQEFYEKFSHPSQNPDVKDWKEVNVYREFIFVRFIYNQMLNSNRNLPADYLIKMQEIWSNSVSSNLESVAKEEVEIIKEALENSRLAKEMVKRNVEVKAKVHIITQYLQNGEAHGWKVYVEFIFPVEALALYFGSGYKQKVYIFVDDGVYEQKFAPFRIKDEASPVGWVKGMTVEGDEVIVCY
ncbi:MAG: hypothetical protein QXV73_04580 [Candidatus Micrarchaeia archaeon]